MAKFKLYLLTFQDHINSSNNGLSNKYFANLISDFTLQQQQIADKTIHHLQDNFCYTYDEQLSLHQNSQKELTFKMDFQIYREDRIENNPYTKNIVIGSQLLLVDAYQQHHLFTVKDIDINLKAVNTVCSYTCQDSFTFQMSKQNDGYEINNNIEDDDFLGAHTIDWWVQKKIVPECFIYYKYQTLAEQGYVDDFYKQTIPFSGSGTADSILISLGETLDLNLHVYEEFLFDTGELIQEFWFEPKKNPEITGLSYSPYSDLQDLSLSHKGDSLTSVLNVYGGMVGDEQITLLPTIPVLFKKIFASEEWMKVPYYQGMFNDIVYGQTFKVNFDEITNNEWTTETINNQLYLIIGIKNLINLTDASWLKYYDGYRFSSLDSQNWSTLSYTSVANGSPYIIQYAAAKHWVLGQQIEPGDPNKEKAFYEDYSEFYQHLKKEQPLYFRIPITADEKPVDNATFNGTVYLTLYRNPTIEETMFAKIAEACPWLENKLIDFSYFINHNLLNKYEYSILIQQIYNNLRKINGRLIYLSDSYYKALSEKTTFLAQLDEKITNLGAKFSAEFLQPYLNQKQIKEEEVQDFLLDYKSLYNTSVTNKILFDYDTIYANYLNKYIGAEQKFFKNIYDFREYWNSPVYIEGAQKLYKYLVPSENNYVFSSNKTSTDHLTDNDINKRIFEVSTDNEVVLVDENNYMNYKIAKYKANDFIPCNVANGNWQYDSTKTYYRLDSTKDPTPLSLKEIKANFIYNLITTSDSFKERYYMRNSQAYSHDWLIPNAQQALLNKFSSSVLLKMINEENVSDQFSFTYKTLKEKIQQESALSIEEANFIYTSNFPLQEVSIYDTIYKYEGNSYISQNKKGYQTVSLCSPLNYTNFYKRVNIPESQYKTATGLTIGSLIATVGLTAIALSNPIGWLVGGAALAATTTMGSMALSIWCNKDTWWDTSGYGNKDISLKYTLANNYKKWISFDKYDKSTNIISAKYFYYTASATDYDNYQASLVQGFPDTYFNKWSKFIPTVNYVQQSGDFYQYKVHNWRALSKTDLVNSKDKYLMILYSVDKSSELCYFKGKKFETLFSSNELPLINGITHYLIELIGQEISFTDFQDFSTNAKLSSVLAQQFVLKEEADDSNAPYSIPLAENDLYLVILHQENYQRQTLAELFPKSSYTLEEVDTVAKSFQYTLYSSNDAEIEPKEEPLFIAKLYLRATEENLTIEDLIDPVSFNKDRNYYSVINEEEGIIQSQLTFEQVRRQGLKYYFYQQQNYEFWNPQSSLAEITLSVYNLLTHSWEDHTFTNLTITKIIDLTQITNGSFWYHYNNLNDSQLKMLQEHAVIIETDLSNYWNQAYAASQLCQYFLPEHWQPIVNNKENPFYSSLFSYRENAKPVAWYSMTGADYSTLFISYPQFDLNNPPSGYNKENWYICINNEFFHYLTDGTVVKYDSLEDLLNKVRNTKIVAVYKMKHLSNEGEVVSGDISVQYYQLNTATYQPVLVIEDRVNQKIGITTDLNHIEINSNWVPKINKVINQENPYIFKLKYFSADVDKYQFISDYDKDLYDQNIIDSNNGSYRIISLENFIHLEPFKSAIEKFQLDIDKWVLIPQYINQQGCYFTLKEGGIIWSQWLEQLYPGKGKFSYFDGYYGMYLNYLNPNNFINGSMSEYEKYYTKHQELWRSLYQQFPSVLLEQKYQNEDATTSEQLLQMAQLVMRDANTIEREYNITTIDVYALKGYEGQQLKIGDAIALAADELYSGFDDIKESLRQFLFITDISYTLRQDTDISLTVNKIKYQDKMIQQLAKLIK